MILSQPICADLTAICVAFKYRLIRSVLSCIAHSHCYRVSRFHGAADAKNVSEGSHGLRFTLHRSYSINCTCSIPAPVGSKPKERASSDEADVVPGKRAIPLRRLLYPVSEVWAWHPRPVRPVRPCRRCRWRSPGLSPPYQLP